MQFYAIKANMWRNRLSEVVIFCFLRRNTIASK
jgi:hypothetical protein